MFNGSSILNNIKTSVRLCPIETKNKEKSSSLYTLVPRATASSGGDKTRLISRAGQLRQFVNVATNDNAALC